MVDGPISYSCWLYMYGGRPTLIHNFGDEHLLRSGCSGKNNFISEEFVSIEELISNTIDDAKKNETVIDLFLEGVRHNNYSHYYINELKLLHRGALNRLEYKFSSCLCLSEDKIEECRKKFPNGRIHAIDLRDVLGYNKRVIPNIENKKSDTWIAFRSTVKNQIYRVEDADVREHLLKLYDSIKALSQEQLQDNFYSDLMDIYLLGRLFRRYDPPFNSKPKTDFNNSPVKNAVIYSGDNHKNIYDKFFKKIKAINLYSFNSPFIINDDIEAQCVEIPTIFNCLFFYNRLPMVEDFKNPGDIANEYKDFEKKTLYRDYAEIRKKKKVFRWNPQQTLFQGQTLPQRKYPRKPRSEEPQAKRQRIGGKEEEP